MSVVLFLVLPICQNQVNGMVLQSTPFFSPLETKATSASTASESFMTTSLVHDGACLVEHCSYWTNYTGKEKPVSSWMGTWRGQGSLLQYMLCMQKVSDSVPLIFSEKEQVTSDENIIFYSSMSILLIFPLRNPWWHSTYHQTSFRISAQENELSVGLPWFKLASAIKAENL